MGSISILETIWEVLLKVLNTTTTYEKIPFQLISTLYLFDQILVQKLFLDCLEEQSNRLLFTDRTDECNLLEACKHRARSVNTFIFFFLFTQSFLYQIKKLKILFQTL